MHSNMNEDRVGQYLREGGELFMVSNMDTIRDGGTTIIYTAKGNYYISKLKILYKSYPMNESNMVTDPLHKEYVLDRIGAYLKSLKEDIIRYENILNHIK